jgi:pimeloyl-ACP methyl ester carboxylesterase
MQKRPMYSIDLRNHGASPWNDDPSVLAMAADVNDFIETHELG